jgi:hypothetical protein
VWPERGTPDALPRSEQETNTMKFSIVAVLGALAISCGGTTAQTPLFRTAVSPSASFSQYRTFAVGLTESPPVGYQLSSRSLDAQTRLRPLIIAALEQKGYVPQREGERADLTVRFGADTREALTRSIAQNPDNHTTFLEGALFVDVFDATSGVEVWHGSVAANVGRGHIDDAQLATGVRELIARFPDRAPSPAAEARPVAVVE